MSFLSSMGVSFNLNVPNITLIENFLPFVFVIPPVDFSTELRTNHESIQIVDMGEVTVTGKRQLQRVSWSGFFPSIGSHFSSILSPPAPEMTLTDWMEKGTTLKLIVPQWTYFLRCKIENLTFSRQDHTGDLYYTITLIEERRDISTSLDVVTGLISKITK